MLRNDSTDRAWIDPERCRALVAGFSRVGRSAHTICVEVITQELRPGEDLSTAAGLESLDVERDCPVRSVRFDIGVVEVTEFLAPAAGEKQREDYRRISDRVEREWSEYGARLESLIDLVVEQKSSSLRQFGNVVLDELQRYWDHVVTTQELELEECRPDGPSPGWVGLLARAYDQLRNEWFELNRFDGQRRSTIANNPPELGGPPSTGRL